MDLQILGEHIVADHIGDHAEGGGGDHHRHDGQAVEAVGEVHGVGEAADRDHAEGDVEPAEIDQQVLEHREGDRGGQGVGFAVLMGAVADQDEGGDAGDGELDQDLGQAGDAGRGLFGDLGVVVEKAQGPVAEGDQQHHPDIEVLQVRPQQGADQQPGQDHEPAHGRGAGLLDDVALDAFLADRLAAALFGAHPVDEARAHQADHHLGRDQGHDGAEGQVLGQVEERHIVRHLAVMAGREVGVEQIEHQPRPPEAADAPRAARASATTDAFDPLDPLTITTSPAATAPATCGASAAAVSA